MQKFVLILSTILCLSVFASAQSTYYVSSSGGNDSNSGKSSSSPWKTLSKLNSTIFRSGDKILFKKGDKWREMLTISSSGNSSSPILFSSYGSGNQPVISGATVLTGFAHYSGNVWRKYTSSPRQVFFSGIRGNKVSSSPSISGDKEWAWSTNYLYVYSSSDPSGKIEVTSKRNGIFITGDYVTVEGLQVEKVYDSGIAIATNSNNIIIDDCRILQWSNAHTSLAGVRIDGSYCEVKNSTFGKKTGNDIEDQGWAGFHGIAINGKSNSVNNNKIYHSSVENESGEGFYTHGIHAFGLSGTTRIFDNYIYHTGGDGISVTSNSRSGDEIYIYGNKVEYSGQGGIQAYKTRSEDGKGGKGYIYKNEVSYANRLGGDVGGKGNQSSGIHFNDGVRSGTDPNKPYMKWYCYENEVFNCQAPKYPTSADACGIIVDYNADKVEVYRNKIYNNNSVGIQIWNANNCKISYNVVYGNDGGIVVNATSSGNESANNNEIANNTLYKNYNGNAKGRNIDAEIFFGMNTKNNVFKNNILYSANEGFAYKYNVTNTSGHVLDNNIIYAEKSIVGVCGRYNQQTFAEWRSHYPSWDRNSKNANPMFNNAGGADFSLKSNSPAINAGSLIGYTADFLLKTLVGTPDIGAIEYGSQSIPPASDPGGDNKIIINAMDGQLRDDAGLGSRDGMKNANTIYFRGYNGAVKYSVNIPRAGTWYAWARMYYMSSGQKNSFYLGMDSRKHVLGDDDTKYDKWHWDGYKGSAINLGQLRAAQYYLAITPREPGLTLWVDQIILTDDPNYNPNGSGSSSNSVSGPQTILINAMSGTLRDDAGLGSRDGMKNINTIYFRGGNGAVKYTVDIPTAGTWYAWARMYYMSSGQKNSFFIGMNSKTHVLGDDDTKYDQWHWDGYKGSPVNLGQLNAAQYTLAILPREPGLTLWVDQIVLTNDPNYNPNKNEYLTSKPPGSSGKTILINAINGEFRDDARLGSRDGMKNGNAVYFRGNDGAVKYMVDIPEAGTWYAWARMYYMSSGKKNSFFIGMNSKTHVLGDDDTKYDKWHWDGNNGSPVNLGYLNASQYALAVLPREPGLTLWIDQIVLTNDPNYDPNVKLGKENAEEEKPEEINALPEKFEISQNFPNPFNPSTTIKYAVPEASQVSLKVYDILGAEVANLVDEVKTPGYYEVNFDGSSLASGIYIYQIRTNNFVMSKKMNLVK